jgi:hypothetical protein
MTQPNLIRKAKPLMTGSRLALLAIFILCISLSAMLAAGMRRSAHGGVTMTDFGEIYYGALCAMQRKDPYNPPTVLREFLAHGATFPKPKNPSDPKDVRVARATVTVITVGVNLPTTLLLAIPFAMLPWSIAQILWVSLMAALLVLASYLAWDLAASLAPGVAGWLAAVILVSCELVLYFGNTAGLVVSLCVIAAWCFFKQRFAWAGIVLLALSLVIKPHDAGFLWLYFLLAGGVLRKRALQTFAVAALLGLAAAIWIAPASPHWVQELHNNLTVVSAKGETSDPSPSGITSGSTGSIIDLQATLSILWNNPRFYSLVSYLLGGSLILTWVLVTLRKRFSQQGAWLALAAISALLLLPVYHRPNDAKILLLALPGCAILWAARGRRGWLALALTAAAIAATSDLPLLLLHLISRRLSISPSTLGGKMMLILLHPAPLLLLAMGCFYLWVYARYNPPANNLQLDAAEAGVRPATAELPS